MRTFSKWTNFVVLMCGFFAVSRSFAGESSLVDILQKSELEDADYDQLFFRIADDPVTQLKQLIEIWNSPDVTRSSKARAGWLIAEIESNEVKVDSQWNLEQILQDSLALVEQESLAVSKENLEFLLVNLSVRKNQVNFSDVSTKLQDLADKIPNKNLRALRLSTLAYQFVMRGGGSEVVPGLIKEVRQLVDFNQAAIPASQLEIYSILGIVLEKIDQELESKTVYSKQEKECDLKSIRHYCSSLIYNLALNLIDEKTPESALKAETYLKKSEELSAQIQDLTSIAQNHYGLLLAYNNLKDYKKAISYGQLAVEYFEKNELKDWAATTLVPLSTAYLGDNNPIQAWATAQKALALSSPDTKTTQVSIFNKLSEIAHILDKPKEAYQYLKMATDLEKALQRESIDKRYLEMKNELQIKKTKDLEQSRIRAILVLILLAMILAFAIYWWGQHKLIKSYKRYERAVKGREALESSNEILQIEMTNANEKLLQADKLATLGTLTASIAHDIANPVGLILGNAQGVTNDLRGIETLLRSLIGTPTSPEAKTVTKRFDELFEAIWQQLGDLEKAGEFLVALSKAIRNQARVTEKLQKQVEIKPIIDECLIILKARLRTAELAYDCPPQAAIDCRRAQLGQVFMNLLANALDAVEQLEGPRKIGIGVSEKIDRDQIGWRFIVEDNGPGVPAELREKILDAFFTTKGVDKGTGLGLSIVQKIVSAHQGIIKIGDSPTLGGARFEVWIPMRALK